MRDHCHIITVQAAFKLLKHFCKCANTMFNTHENFRNDVIESDLSDLPVILAFGRRHTRQLRRKLYGYSIFLERHTVFCHKWETTSHIIYVPFKLLKHSICKCANTIQHLHMKTVRNDVIESDLSDLPVILDLWSHAWWVPTFGRYIRIWAHLTCGKVRVTFSICWGTAGANEKCYEKGGCQMMSNQLSWSLSSPALVHDHFLKKVHSIMHVYPVQRRCDANHLLMTLNSGYWNKFSWISLHRA